MGLTQHEAGVSLLARILENAITFLNNSLTVISSELDIHRWFTVQFWIGTAFSARLAGNSRDNIEHALGCFQIVLASASLISDKILFAKAQMHMGVAFHKRRTGDRVENLENTIECYQLSLETFIQMSNPQAWASTQENVGAP